MDLAIVILVWRNQQHLPELLRSIAAQETTASFEVVVCHNGVADPGASRQPLVAPAGLALSEIHTGGNLGYAGGNNFAIDAIRQRAEPRYFLVLNSDVVLGEGALQAAIAWADAHPDVAVTGAVQDDPARPGRTLYGGCRYNRALSIITPNASPDGAIDYVHGAALLLRAEAFRGAEAFAGHYFFFFEELELAERVRARGMKIGFCPSFRVIHHEGASRTRASNDFVPEMAEYFENLGALRFTRAHHPLLLPTVLLARGPGKLLVLALRGQGTRLAFWALALADFFRRRVRRFPFQAGWQPRLENEKLVDSGWPMRTGARDRL